jgi:hypothetical protein
MLVDALKIAMLDGRVRLYGQRLGARYNVLPHTFVHESSYVMLFLLPESCSALRLCAP